MKIMTWRNIIAAIGVVASIVLILQYQNCAPAGQSQSSFVLGSNNTPPQPVQAPFTASPISMPANTVQQGTSIIASSTIFGAGSDQAITCAWSMTTSTGSAIGSSFSGSAVNGQCTLSTGSLAAPTAGSYNLILKANNTSGASSQVSASFTTTTGPVQPGFSASLTVDFASGVYVGDTITFTATGNGSQASNLSIEMGYFTPATGVATPFTGAGCTSSTSNATTVQASCTQTMSTVGIKYFYAKVYSNGSPVKQCTGNTTSPDLSCTGNFATATYSISVLNVPIGGGGGGGCLGGTRLQTPCTY